MNTTIHRHDWPKGLSLTSYKLLRTWQCKSVNPERIQLIEYDGLFYELQLDQRGYCTKAIQVFFATTTPIQEFEQENLDRLVI